MMPFPKLANPYDDDAQRLAQAEARLDPQSRRPAVLVVAGCVALVAFAALTLAGLPGSGLILVPSGLGMLLGGGIELVLGRFGA